MKNAFFNKRGEAIHYYIIVLTFIGVVGFGTYKLFETGHWILGSLTSIFLLFPAFIILINKIKGGGKEK